MLQYRYKSNEVFMTFVGPDPNGKSRPVPPVTPNREEEKETLRRRAPLPPARPVPGGKMKPADAGELEALFYEQQ